jgi:hypothetical protein
VTEVCAAYSKSKVKTGINTSLLKKTQPEGHNLPQFVFKYCIKTKQTANC